ncbi:MULTISPECIES: hypothetical protein [Pseudarthrobacter]|uniref:hypothetical protein n=1 Tax=Pseudarthrobacter TaxID=1742993 RepID=UPI0013DB2B43|nr:MULTISPECIES: hypothetical protein [Pseudarthrobacter]MDQ0000110.1 hypothetical protein [Pseudarthrobacter sulfonivorans]
MGDISRHRDIFLFTQDVVPPQLLSDAGLTAGDMTYLELGNYLTDVSQFRDPVTYIFAKQRIWRDIVIPTTRDKTQLLRGISALVAGAALAGSQVAKELLSGTAEDVAEGAAFGLAALGGILAALPSDTYADLAGADTWIDTLLGTPIERTQLDKTPGARALRDVKHFGYLGEFFRLFIEGTTHFLFAQDVPKRTDGNWGKVKPIPESRVEEVFKEFFTQYYPHEHTDQPPYTWDASKRPSHPNMYGPGRRQANLRDGDIGVMNAVDVHYVGYLAEALAKVEQDWQALKRDDQAGRQQLLVRMGKLLHGVEDWFFHSNVVELLELRSFRPEQFAGESDEVFLERFVSGVAKHRPEFVAADATERLRLKRRLYRRLRFPAYDSGTKTQSAGRLSSTRMSTPSLRHAYPAFPSSQDTAHTLLHALENLEHKAAGEPGELPTWVTSALEQSGLEAPQGLGQLGQPVVMAGLEHKLREWVPLILTLLSENERQRLAANVALENWPLTPGTPRPPRTVKETEVELQTKRHAAALEPHKTKDGRTENNYEEFVRYLVARGHLNAHGKEAMVAAFEIDRKAEQLPTDAPGCGGFLIQFAVQLQELLDAGDAATDALNKRRDSVHGQESDNGAFNEIVGSHSLMSKDTLTSVPFFNDARVLASVASSSVFTIMLQQAGARVAGRRLAWDEVLHHLIRFPPSNGGWERRALAIFGEKQQIPTFSDLPEFTRLVGQSVRTAAPVGKPRHSKREELEERYLRLEAEVSKYRYP